MIQTETTAQALTVAQNTALAPVALIERARDYAAAGMAPNTLRAYRADWEDFAAWCDDAGQSALPASATTVALYLTDRAGQITVATLSRRLASIRSAHRQAGAISPASFALDQVWAGIRRSHGRPARPKRAMMVADVRLAVQTAPDTLAGKRDRALILIGFAGALRRSELTAIDIEGEGAGPVRVRLVAGGLEVLIDRSKGDQTGEGAVVGIPYGANPETCPVLALQSWLDAAGITAGPVFRSINRWGQIGGSLSANMVARIVKAGAGRIGLDPKAFAGHSLRAGLATSAAFSGQADALTIQRHLRHAKGDTTARYIRDGERFRVNAAAAAGL